MIGLMNLTSHALTSHADPIPIPPAAPNFCLCSGAYGTGLTHRAALNAGAQLPQGTLPVTYSVGESVARYHLPFLIFVGDISISVDVSGPNEIKEINLVPNDIRGMAGYIANTCVRGSGVGGFVTKKLQGLVDFVTDPTSDIENPPYPDSTGFLTLTLADDESYAAFPGDYDPQMARFLRQAEIDVLEEVDPYYRTVIAGRIATFAMTELLMRRLETRVPWWGGWRLQGNRTTATTIQLVNMTTESVTTARRRKRAAGLLR